MCTEENRALYKLSIPVEKSFPRRWRFSQAIRNECVPHNWKIARVIPLHKKRPRNLLNNYRPISIHPIVRKVFEKVLYEQLYNYLIANNLLSNKQFGFRRFHSTTSALLDSTNEWFVNIRLGLAYVPLCHGTYGPLLGHQISP